MNINITVTFAKPLDVRFFNVPDASVLGALSQLRSAVQQLGATMSPQLERLTREVAESRTVTESAVTMIGGLADQIRQLKDDPAALEALADDLDSQQTALAAKISENTPAAEPTP